MKRICKVVFILVMLVAFTSFMNLTAQAAGLLPGSSLTFNFTNFPGASSPGASTSISTTFGGNTIDSVNHLQVFSFSVPTGGGGEWDYFHLATTDGSPIGAFTNGYWSIHMDFVMGQAVFFDGVERQWLDGTNPTPANPNTNWGVGAPLTIGPIGNGYGNGYGTDGPDTFSYLVAAGPFTNWFEIYVNPYSTAALNGVDAAADGYYFAYHFTAPLPGTLPLVLSGLGVLVAVRRRWIA
jgi:hypothetical protein